MTQFNDATDVTKPIVEIKGLTKVIGNKKIIDNLSLSLYPGQITGFLGPNGSGKTTTIRMMTGLMKATEGDVLIDGHSIQSSYEKAINNVGVIVENPEMYKYLSGYKNLLHFARMHNNVSKERIDEVVKQVGLENRIHEKVSTYSLGMRQRLGLAQSLLHNPKFLILDEPTNGLDPAGIREFRTHLRKIATENQVSIFVSSHLLSEMELMCDRIAVINSGKLIDMREIHSQTTTVYAIEATPLDQALAQLQDYQYTVEGETIFVEVEKASVPVIVSNLVKADVFVYGVAPHKKTLEDQFIEMTGGGSIAETNTK